MDATDGELIGRYRRGDVGALEALVEKYRRPLFGFICVFLCSFIILCVQVKFCKKIMNIRLLQPILASISNL